MIDYEPIHIGGITSTVKLLQNYYLYDNNFSSNNFDYKCSRYISEKISLGLISQFDINTFWKCLFNVTNKISNIYTPFFMKNMNLISLYRDFFNNNLLFNRVIIYYRFGRLWKNLFRCLGINTYDLIENHINIFYFDLLRSFYIPFELCWILSYFVVFSEDMIEYLILYKMIYSFVRERLRKVEFGLLFSELRLYKFIPDLYKFSDSLISRKHVIRNFSHASRWSRRRHYYTKLVDGLCSRTIYCIHSIWGKWSFSFNKIWIEQLLEYNINNVFVNISLSCNVYLEYMTMYLVDTKRKWFSQRFVNLLGLDNVQQIGKYLYRQKLYPLLMYINVHQQNFL